MSAALSMDRTLWDAQQVREYLRIGSARTFDRARSRPTYPQPQYINHAPGYIVPHLCANTV